MKIVPNLLFEFYRRYFGSWSLEDPRPIKAEAPYSYYLPPQEHIDFLEVGDLAKMIFMPRPVGKYDAERMWVEITEVNLEDFKGTLTNDPDDMPMIKFSDPVTFKAHHIIDIESERELPEREPQLCDDERVWERCMVDDCVLYDGVKVEYIYRENPDMGKEDDRYPDSGWRIRGDMRGLSDEETDKWTASYIAIAKVLNEDDSWFHLLDSPVGSRFMCNFETGEYEACE